MAKEDSDMGSRLRNMDRPTGRTMSDRLAETRGQWSEQERAVWNHSLRNSQWSEQEKAVWGRSARPQTVPVREQQRGIDRGR